MSNFSQNANTGARLAHDKALDKIKAARSANYTVTSGDVSNKYTSSITVLWDAPFADTNYSVSLAVEGVQVANAQKDGYAAARFVKSITGVTAFVSAPNGTAGDVISVHVFAIHD